MDLGFSFFDFVSSSELSSGGLTILSLITETTLDFCRLRTGAFFFFFASSYFGFVASFISSFTFYLTYSFLSGSGTLGIAGMISSIGAG